VSVVHSIGLGATPARFAATAIVCLLICAPAALAAPVNDNLAGASPLGGASPTATGTNVEATKEPGEPNHAGAPGGHSVWWAWTAPAGGEYTLDSCGADFDTLLAVYVGESVGALAGIASNDDGPCGAQSSLTFVATAGQAYWFAVDGRGDETGGITLDLAPTLQVQAITLVRRNAVDATRFVIDVASGGDDLPDPPELTLLRNGKRQSIDLEVDGESTDDRHFTYTFGWSCERHGRWNWTVSVQRGGRPASRQGSFTVPRCQKQGWYVSRSKVVNGYARDFGREDARWLRCRPVGKRRGSRARTWRCVQARPGFRCSGGFRFRYSLTRQGGDIVSRKRTPSGSVTCRR
jgi:hypothetical protein